MMWNGSKFVAVRLGPKLALKDDTLLFTPGFSEPINVQESTRDLGIFIDAEASFRPQRLAVIKKMKAKAAWTLRTFKSREPGVMWTLRRSVV